MKEHAPFMSVYRLNPDVIFILFVEGIPEPNVVSDCIKVFLDDPQWLEHNKDPQLKQIKRQTSSNI